MGVLFPNIDFFWGGSVSQCSLPNAWSLWSCPINRTSTRCWTMNRVKCNPEEKQQGPISVESEGMTLTPGHIFLLELTPTIPQLQTYSSPKSCRGSLSSQHGKWDHSACFLRAGASQAGGVAGQVGHQLLRLFVHMQPSGDFSSSLSRLQHQYTVFRFRILRYFRITVYSRELYNAGSAYQCLSLRN